MGFSFFSSSSYPVDIGVSLDYLPASLYGRVNNIFEFFREILESVTERMGAPLLISAFGIRFTANDAVTDVGNLGLVGTARLVEVLEAEEAQDRTMAKVLTAGCDDFAAASGVVR